MSKSASQWAAAALLAVMFLIAGGAALRESVTVDEFAHVGAGLSYWQRLDMRLNGEHPPLGKLLAGLPLAVRGTRADYSSPAWQISKDFFYAYGGQFPFGDAILGRWNDWKSTIMWARLPMLLLTLALGWVLYRYGYRIGGPAGRLVGACLTDRLADGLSLVYSFYAPPESKRSLGAFMILDAIARARALGLPHVYLGYWVEGSRKMAYKVAYLPQERLGLNGWNRVERE